MSISQGNIATAADINAIIAAIKTEQSRRGIGQETMNKLSGDFERAADPTTLKSDLAAINSKHTTTLSVTHTNFINRFCHIWSWGIGYIHCSSSSKH